MQQRDEHRLPIRPGTAVPEPRTVAEQTKDLGKDLGDLVALRLEHARVELLELVDDRLNRVTHLAILVGSAALAGLFLLIAAAYGLGEALDHWAWGFLLVGVGLGAGGGLLAWTRPQLIRLERPPKVERYLLESRTQQPQPTASEP